MLSQIQLPSTGNNADLTLLFFKNDWCVQCYTQAPIVKLIARRYANDLAVKVINIDQEIALAVSYQIYAAPSMILFKNNQIVERIPRFVTQEQLDTIIKYYL